MVFFWTKNTAGSCFFLFFVQGKPTRSKDVQAAFFVVKDDKEIVKKPTSHLTLSSHFLVLLYNHPVSL